MRTIVLAAAGLALLLFLSKLISTKLMRCPKCRQRGIEIVERTKYWVKYKCRRCGNSYVEETGH